MKIRITGHTKGIGECLYLHLKELGHDVVGFSRTNGYDINDPQSQQKIVNESKDADVFINNAWSEYSGQTEMLRLMLQTWDQQTKKKILNLSSKASFNNEDVSADLERYGANKREQNKMIEQRINSYGPHILNVILGCTDTQLSYEFEGKKINPKELTGWLVKMLLCETMYFQSVTIDAPGLDYKFKQ